MTKREITMKRSLSVLFAVLMTASLCSTGLTGCATVTQGSTKSAQTIQSEVAKFKKGVTTYEQVVEKLGPPQYAFINQGMLTVHYDVYEQKHDSSIPVIGTFVSGMIGLGGVAGVATHAAIQSGQKDTNSSQKTILVFNQKTKILEDVLQTASSGAVKTNLAN